MKFDYDKFLATLKKAIPVDKNEILRTTALIKKRDELSKNDKKFQILEMKKNGMIKKLLKLKDSLEVIAAGEKRLYSSMYEELPNTEKSNPCKDFVL